MFGSDVPIVLTSMQEKGESLMGKDRAVGQVAYNRPLLQFGPEKITELAG
ncbi:hypothetical protein AVEN_209993-1, partial [Araneus ventricosus]